MGDDAYELLEEIFTRFPIDMTGFDGSKYTRPEGNPLLTNLWRCISGKELVRHTPTYDLRIRDIERVVIDGKWTDPLNCPPPPVPKKCDRNRMLFALLTGFASYASYFLTAAGSFSIHLPSHTMVGPMILGIVLGTLFFGFLSRLAIRPSPSLKTLIWLVPLGLTIPAVINLQAIRYPFFMIVYVWIAIISLLKFLELRSRLRTLGRQSHELRAPQLR